MWSCSICMRKCIDLRCGLTRQGLCWQNCIASIVNSHFTHLLSLCMYNASFIFAQVQSKKCSRRNSCRTYICENWKGYIILEVDIWMKSRRRQLDLLSRCTCNMLWGRISLQRHVRFRAACCEFPAPSAHHLSTCLPSFCPVQPLEYAIPAAVTKIRIKAPLTVFVKNGQLDFSGSSDSISDNLSLIFPEFLGYPDGTF